MSFLFAGVPFSGLNPYEIKSIAPSSEAATRILGDPKMPFDYTRFVKII